MESLCSLSGWLIKIFFFSFIDNLENFLLTSQLVISNIIYIFKIIANLQDFSIVRLLTLHFKLCSSSTTSVPLVMGVRERFRISAEPLVLQISVLTESVWGVSM